MRVSITTSRRNRLLALAVGGIPLSLCASASAGTYWTDAGTFAWLNSGDWTNNWPDGALWPQAGNHNTAIDQPQIALVTPSFGQRTNAGSPRANSAMGRTASFEITTRAIASPALSLYSWDAALADPAPGTVLIKVDNTPGDADFGDVILQGNSATLYTLVIKSFSGSMNSGRYNSLASQYAGGGGSEAATLQGLAVDNTTNHGGFFAVFSQTSSKMNEAGLGVTLDFAGNSQSVDLSTQKNGKNLFSGTTDDLVFEWSSRIGLLVDGMVEYSSTYYPTPTPPTNPAYWKSGVANGNWSAGGNWSSTSASGTDNAGAPGSSSNALIVHSDNINRVVTLDQNSTLSSLQIGNTGGGTDTLSQTSAFSLSMTTETVGAGSGSIGAHIQSAGTNTYSQALNIGSGTGSIGSYSVSGSGAVTVNASFAATTGINVGISGSGTFNQSGGTVAIINGTSANLYVGEGASGAGTYLLGGSSTLSVGGSEFVGYYGAGTFNQTGGTNTVSGALTAAQDGLCVGYANGSAGTYNLSGGTLTVLGNYSLGYVDVIGYGGAGTFDQSGGLHTTNLLAVGIFAPGIYLLSNGSLNAGTEWVGANNAGTFNQSGGVNTCSGLTVGSAPFATNSTGIYLLSGGTLDAAGINVGSYETGSFSQSGGTIVAGGETVGSIGAGTFSQSGGVNTIGTPTTNGNLEISAYNSGSGTYLLSGTGSLTVNGSVYIGPGGSNPSHATGTLDISGGSMTVAGTIAVDSGGSLIESGGTLSVGELLVYSGGTLELTGGTLNAQTTEIERINAAGFASFTTTKNLTLAGVLALYEDAASEAATTSRQSFVIVQATNGGVLSGAFSNISSGQVLTTTDNTASFLVTINGGVNGDVVLSDFQAIPEPSAVGVLGVAAASMLLRRRRRIPMQKLWAQIDGRATQSAASGSFVTSKADILKQRNMRKLLS